MIKGLYIHIPFCNLKCPYCDFTSVVLEDKTVFQRYIEILKRELSFYKDKNVNLETIYLGGGTPSLLETKYIEDLLNFVKKNFNIVKTPEITIEVNPKTYRYKDFLHLKEIGVNRVSVGSQSFLEKNLKILGRDHSPTDTFQTVEDILKAGIENINLDLIYGIEGQTLKDLEKDLQIYTSLNIKHISAYMLTPYSETPLGKLVEKGEFKLPTDEELKDMYILITEFLKGKGFIQYEISNWAKEGYKCKHNLFYWEDVNFLGIGVSAWSYIDNIRFGNTKNIYEYMEKVEKGIKPVLFQDVLTKKDILREKIILGLRLTKGIDKNLIKTKQNLIEDLKNENLVKEENNRIKLTSSGFLVSNYIISKLLD